MIGRPPVLERTLVGFRAFRERNGELYSLTPAGGGRDRWPAGGIVDAACERPRPGLVPHRAPAAGCGCGAYAVDSLATLLRTLAHFWMWRVGAAGNVVMAAVLIWSSPGRPVLVGELRGKPGYQYRAPHMRVLALAESPAARRVAGRYPVPVLPAAGLELYASEHGRLMRPGRAVRRPADAATSAPRYVGSGAAGAVARLIAALPRPGRAAAPWAWTLGLAVAFTLAASIHLSLVVAWRAVLLAATVAGWLVPRLAYLLVRALINPFEALWLTCVAVVAVVVVLGLLVTAWVWTADLIRWAAHR